MYYYSIIPATKIPISNTQTFTYSSRRLFEVGHLVEVPMGKRKIIGVIEVIIENFDPSFSKFKIKEIDNNLYPLPFLSSKNIDLLKRVSLYYFCSLGLLLKISLPPLFINKYKPVKFSFPSKENLTKTKPVERSFSINIDRMNFLSDLESEDGRYEQYINSKLKQNQQILIIVPEVLDLINIGRTLSKIFKGVNISTIYHHSKRTQLFKDLWDIRLGKSKIIIGTRQSIFLSFKQLGTILIIDEHNEYSLKEISRAPYYDARKVALILARIWKAEINFLSPFPTVALMRHYLLHKGKSDPIIKDQNVKKGDNLSVIDMRRSPWVKDKLGNYKEFISQTLLDSISTNLKKDKSVILYNTKKGAFNFIKCQECENVIECPNCAIPLTKIYIKKKEFLKCFHCDEKLDFPTECPKCRDKNLSLYGVGNQEIKRYLDSLFSTHYRIRILDATVRSIKKKREIIQEYSETKPMVILGNAAVQRLTTHKNTGLVSIISMDGLLSIPEYKAGEKAYRIIRTLIKNSHRYNLIIQTYHLDNPIIQKVLKGNDLEFYKNELEARQKYGYPPFSQLIRLTLKANSEIAGQIKMKECLKTIKMGLKKYQINDIMKILSARAGFIKKINNKYIFNIFLKYGRPGESDRDKILKLIPAGWNIDIDPIDTLG